MPSYPISKMYSEFLLVLLKVTYVVSFSDSDSTDSESNDDEDNIKGLDIVLHNNQGENGDFQMESQGNNEPKIAREHDTDCESYVFGSENQRTTKSTAIYKEYSVRSTSTLYSEPTAPAGPLYDFIVNICNVTVTRLSSRKIGHYMLVLSQNIKGLGSGFLMRRTIKKFRKNLKLLSAIRGKILRIITKEFLNYLTRRLPMKDEFFEAANPIYGSSEDIRFDDYIYDLKRYGLGRLKNIDGRTRYIFERIVFRTFRKQEEIVRDDIVFKFKLMVLEYMELKRRNDLGSIYLQGRRDGYLKR